MQKGDVIEGLKIERMAAEGKCITHVEGQVLFLTGGAPEDLVTVQVTKIKKSFLEGKVIRIEQPSPYRTNPFCEHFGICGGCAWQHLDYGLQLENKKQQVIDNFERIGGLIFPPVQNILPSEKIRHYRNRLDFSFSSQRWLTPLELRQQVENSSLFNTPALGFHLPRMFDKILDLKNCYLQPNPSNAIRLALKDESLKHNIPFFNIRKKEGFLRTLTIRSNNEGQVMVILQVYYKKQAWIDLLFKKLKNDFPQISSFLYIINEKGNDSFQDQEVLTWSGEDFLMESLMDAHRKEKLKFKIGPKSFFQTNTLQAEKLYRSTWEMAQFQGHERVYDLYTGTGSIACYVARDVKKVIGLEYVEEAVADARMNAERNQIHNASFFAGDIAQLLNDEFIAQHGHPDVVITDPPRNGMHEKVCAMLLKIRPEKIIYVSCNPATQARDLKWLAEAYTIEAIQPVDMFPHTIHVENIVRLKLKNSAP